MNKKINFLKGFAILLVVLGHSIIIYDPSWGLYTTTNQNTFFEILKRMINFIQMPLFFSISGYLFYYTLHKKMQKKLL